MTLSASCCQEARNLIAVKERLRCGDRVNGAAWPVVPQAVQAAIRRPPQLVEAELERLQRNLAKVLWQCLARPDVVPCLGEALHKRPAACSVVKRTCLQMS